MKHLELRHLFHKVKIILYTKADLSILKNGQLWREPPKTQGGLRQEQGVGWMAKD